MTFARSIWRFLVGVKDALVLIFMLLFFAVLFMVLTARPNPAEVRSGALMLELDGVIVEERTPVDPFAALLSGAAPTQEHQVRDLVRAIDLAASDDRVEAVVLDLGEFLGGGQVHLKAVGAALDRVRAADKPVLAYATAYYDDSLLLAAHASEVWMDPMGGAVVAGPGGENLYFGEALDKLGVNARVYRVGTYKSAVEPYESASMSPAARENYEALFGALWREWKANVATARPQAQIERVAQRPAEWLASGDGDFGTAARSARLVDKLGSRADFDARVVELIGPDEWDDRLNAFASTDYADLLADTPMVEDGRTIAVVTIAGTIVDGDAGPGTAGGTRIAELLDEALNDEIAGLVVRVDSPGGSVLASEEIRRAILRHKAKDVPVAVSMGNVAASGGYWVATPADRIFAEPDTITGSIGIFAVIPTFEELAGRLGVGTDGVRTTPLSGEPNLVGGFNEEMDAILQAGIEDGYRDFLTRVAQSRDMTLEEADAVGQGRVYDGGTARELGLVDAYGGLAEAVVWVAERAGLDDEAYHTRYLGSEEVDFDTLFAQWLLSDDDDAQGHGGSDFIGVLTQRRSIALRGAFMQTEQMLATRGAQAYCLECPTAATVSAHSPKPFSWLRLARSWLDE